MGTKKDNSDRIRAIDMFCGAGGSSDGARRAGAKIVAGFDIWEPATKVFKANFPDSKVYLGDIKKLDPSAVKNEIGEIDLILASPECRSHSRARGNGKRSKASKDTAFEVIRFAQVFKPKWIIMENVKEFASWDRFDELIQSLKSLNYNVNENINLNAKDFRVPQSRERRYIVCSQLSTPNKPKPTGRVMRSVDDVINKNGHYKFTNLRKENRAPATITKAEHAINNLNDEDSFLIVYYGSGKNGNGGWQKVSDPLRTITTIDRFAYVKQESDGYKMRMLQPEELKLAMGYKARFKLEKVEGITRRDRVKLMGNGVCPPVMEAIVKSVTS